METVRAHVWVEGDVQGVYFRSECRDQAIRRSVGGWVRNLPDGRVEAVFEGGQAAVREMIEWCHHGPRYARVERVDVNWDTPTGAETTFRIAR